MFICIFVPNLRLSPVFGNLKYDFYGTNIASFDFNIENIIQFIIKSNIVLSNDIEYLLFSLIVSDIRVFSSNVFENTVFDLFNNACFIESENEIITNRDMSPYDVVKLI